MKNAIKPWMLALALGCPAGAGAATVTLDWDAVTLNADGTPIADLSGYRVFHATYSLLSLTTGQAMTAPGVGRFPASGLVTGITATVPNLADGATIYFRLTAVDTSGNQSSFSDMPLEVSTFTPPPQPPASPATLTATPASSSQINLSWGNVSGETGFRVERSAASGSGYVFVASVSANVTAYNNAAGLSPSTTYYYRVFAYNAVGNSSPSPEASARTQDPPVSPPVQPTGLYATGVTTTSVSLAWADNSNDETGFELRWSLTGTGGWTVIPLGANSATYTHPSLPSGTSYYYQIRAVNGVGSPAFGPLTPVLARTTAVPGPGPSGFTPPPGLKEAYCYPNPAVGVVPVIRAMMGGVEFVEVTIFDQAGVVVHSGRSTHQISVNGEPAFEYRWTGEKATGVYYAVIHGKKGEETIRARASFAVIK